MDRGRRERLGFAFAFGTLLGYISVSRHAVRSVENRSNVGAASSAASLGPARQQSRQVLLGRTETFRRGNGRRRVGDDLKCRSSGLKSDSGFCAPRVSPHTFGLHLKKGATPEGESDAAS